jgi:hypothetical protein
MKTSYTSALVLAFAALTAGQAMAADNNVVGKTRAQVQAELAQYKADHKSDLYTAEFEPLSGQTSLDNFAAAPSTVTREQVKAELAQFKADHKNDIYSTDFEPFAGQLIAEKFAAAPSTVDRAQVKVELAQYKAEHKNDTFDPTTLQLH